MINVLIVQLCAKAVTLETNDFVLAVTWVKDKIKIQRNSGNARNSILHIYFYSEEPNVCDSFTLPEFLVKFGGV